MYPGSLDPDKEKNTIGTIANQRRIRSLRSKVRRRPGISMKVQGKRQHQQNGNIEVERALMPMHRTGEPLEILVDEKDLDEVRTRWPGSRR